MQSDSEPIEMAENDPTAAPTVQTEDREEDRKFLAMLELAPRSVVEAVIANNSAPASRSESPSIVSVVETKSADVDPLLSNGVKVSTPSLITSLGDFYSLISNRTIPDPLNKLHRK